MTNMSIYTASGKLPFSLSEGVTEKIKGHDAGLQTQVPA